MLGPAPERINKPPLYEGMARAWLVDIDQLRATIGRNPNEATVAAWIVEAPWAHGFWHSYMIFVVHLRQTEGGEPPWKFSEEMTHQIGVFALDPNSPREPVIQGLTPPAYLTPQNFAAQFVAENDAAAAKWVEEDAVKRIVAGTLNPDTDFLRQWTAIFGDNMVKK